jgi:hypothetical protein
MKDDASYLIQTCSGGGDVYFWHTVDLSVDASISVERAVSIFEAEELQFTRRQNPGRHHSHRRRPEDFRSLSHSFNF